MHDLIELLRNSGFGCYVIQKCISCILFADDIVLLSPSRRGLQEMLDVCVAYCKRYCLDFNAKKSQVMVVSKERVDHDNLHPLFVKDAQLEFVSEYKYLGVILGSDRGLRFPATSAIRSFYRAANSILHGRVKPDQNVLMRLLYTNCVPILTYACSVKEYSAADMLKCHVAVNNAIRKIFSFAVWQSIRHLRTSHGFKSIYELFELAKRKFLASASSSSNAVFAKLSSLTTH